jgi:prephenate dehydrogenase
MKVKPISSAKWSAAFKLQKGGTFKAMGMRIRYMDPKAHDKHIAYVSHLSHISAFMLGKTVINKENTSRIFDMAGSGFESTVRLAKSFTMWTILNRIKYR